MTATIPGVVVKEAELSVTFPHNNARIRLYGSDNYDRMRGIYLDGCIIDEAGDQDPRAWSEVIRPALSDRKGWAVFIGTPKGKNQFYDIYQNSLTDPAWFSLILKASETALIDYSELADAKRAMSKEQYQQEFECSFTAGIMGAFYAKGIEELEQGNHLTSVPYDRSADVFASMDLGINDSTAIWVGQLVGREFHFIDHYENSGEDLGHYVDWLKSRSYPIHQLILPHDADARELQTGKSRAQFLRERGFKCRVLPRTNDLMGDIDLVRSKFNRFWFDATSCARGVDCLRNYKAEYDHKNQILKRKPLHDWTSNSADSFRYMIIGMDERPKQKEYTKRFVSGLV